MIVKSLLFPEALSIGLRSMKLTNISSDCLPCPWDCRDAEQWNFGFHITFAMASKQSWSQTGLLCNLGQAAGARPLHPSQWSRPPHRATRVGVVQISHEISSAGTAAVTQWRARLCAYVKADGGHFWTLFMTLDEWSHWFIEDKWTCNLCCHGNLCFWRVIENVIKYDL